MLFKRNNRKKVGIREKTASFVSQRQDSNSQPFSQQNFDEKVKSNQPSMLILEKKSEVKYAVHICLFLHPPLTPNSGR